LLLFPRFSFLLPSALTEGNPLGLPSAFFQPIHHLLKENNLAMNNQSKSRKAPPPIIFILLGLCIFFGNNWLQKNGVQIINLSSFIESFQLPEQRYSLGEHLLIKEKATNEKREGIKAFAEQNYQSAIALFQASLAQVPNDPESLIYLNNAKVAKGNPVKIAVIAPISSDLDLAQEMLRGVAQAQDRFNSQGGNLQVEIVNDENDPEIAVEVANELVKNSSILAIVGHYSSDASLAAAPVYEQNGLVTISPTSTSVSLADAGDYIFRTVPSDLFAGNSLAEYFLEKLNKQKAAIFYNSESNYSKSLKDAFNTNLLNNGGEIVAESDVIDPNFNADKAVQQAINQGAEALILLTNSKTLKQTFEIAKVNDRQLLLLGGDDLYIPETLESVGENVAGMVLAVPWHIESNTNSDFIQTANSLWKGKVNWRTAMAYDATQSLIAGIKTNPSRQGIQQTLSQAGFSVAGASGAVKFLLSGDRNKAVQLVGVGVAPNSEFGYSFVPVD
jgi:branched-chain amino acid transport system substrate-binding protein